jgi:hypothetical protein
MPLHQVRLTALICLLGALPALAARPDGTLEVKVLDANTGQPIAARMRLRQSSGRPAKSRGLGVAQHGDHYYVDGQADLGLRRGQYTFELEAGPEYKPVSGHFEIERRAEDSKTVEMHRAADLGKEGWRGADLLAERGGSHFSAAMRGELLSYCPLTAWRNDGGGWSEVPTAVSEAGSLVIYGPSAARLRTDAGDLLFVRPEGALSRQDLKTIGGASLAELRAARESGLRVIAADAASWRLPIWLAGDVLDAVVVVDASDQPRQNKQAKSWGRSPDAAMFPGDVGAARWREAIYFQLLNAGLRLAPVAGSGTGGNDLPLGACRVYANTSEPLAPEPLVPEEWWDSVATGEVMVTNGPLLRPIPLPGRVYRLPEDSPGVSLALNLTTRSRVEYLEVIQNGRVEHSVPLRDLVDSRGRLPEIDCQGAGWFLLRAVATDFGGYERGMTGPYYYEPAGGTPRISRQSCEFFLAWLDEAQGHASEEEVASAREFWEARLEMANTP